MTVVSCAISAIAKTRATGRHVNLHNLSRRWYCASGNCPPYDGEILTCLGVQGCEHPALPPESMGKDGACTQMLGDRGVQIGPVTEVNLKTEVKAAHRSMYQVFLASLLQFGISRKRRDLWRRTCRINRQKPGPSLRQRGRMCCAVHHCRTRGVDQNYALPIREQVAFDGTPGHF